MFPPTVTIKDLTKNLLLLSFSLNASPIIFKRYVDDSHARFENKQKSLRFVEILNKKDSSIQYTIEFENDQKQLNFFNTIITNNGTNFYDFKIFRKLPITNVQINTNSNMAPNISVAVFKGFLSRTCKICSKRYVYEEIQFLIDVFTENDYERKNVEKISKSYLNELQNLLVTSERNSDDTNKIVKLPCVPIIGSRSRKAFRKKNIKTIFTSNSSLKSLLC